MAAEDEIDFAFDYDDLEKEDFRLLRLRPGKENEDLAGELVTCVLYEDASAESVPTKSRDGKLIPVVVWGMYDAISYTWGRGTPGTELIIYETYEPTIIRGRIPIKPNLEDALKTFRKSIDYNSEQFYWIDAICINQSNEKEKSAQIEKMKTIYNRAEVVRVWLGEETPRVHGAMEFVNEMNDLNALDQLSTDVAYDTKWRAFRELMRSDWFNRRWIIQEIALARDAVVHCGEKQIPWHDFAYAVSVFVEKASDLKKLFQQSRKYSYNPDYLGELETLGAKVLVDITANLLRKTDEGEVLEYLLPLEALMSTLIAFEASKPHDTIYSILSLAHDAIPESSALRHDAVTHTPTPSPQSSLIKKPMPQIQTQYDSGFTYNPDDLVKTPVEMSGSWSSAAGGFPFLTRRPSNTPQPPQSPYAALGHPGNFLKPPGRERSHSISRQSKLDAEKDVRKPFKYIKVDYQKPIFEVCREFAEFAIMNSRSLDIMCWPWGPVVPVTDQEPPMPSWIIPVTRRPFDLVSAEQVYHRAFADPLMGAPGMGPPIYNASGKTRAHSTDPEKLKSLIIGSTLMTKGRLLDVISRESRQSSEGSIPREWRELGGWEDIKQAPPSRFWRTLVADRSSDSKSVPAHFPKACQWAFNVRGPSFAADTGRLMDKRDCPKLAVPFLRRVQAVTWNRKLVLTTGPMKADSNHQRLDSLLALVPGEASEGDLICILNGCSVPVVLRKKEVHFERVERHKRDSTPKAVRFTGSLKKGPQKRSTWNTPERPQTMSPKSSTDGSIGGIPQLERTVSPTDTISTAVSDSKQEDEYVLIGECFVYGMMEGEGFKYADDAGHKEKEFALV